ASNTPRTSSPVSSTATATNRMMKHTSEMMKLNFITDHGSIRLSVRCALRAAVLAVLLSALGDAATASAAISEPPCAASEVDASAASALSGDSPSAPPVVSGPPAPVTSSESVAVPSVSVSGPSTSVVLAASTPLLSVAAGFGSTAADYRCALSDIATLPLNSPYSRWNSGRSQDRSTELHETNVTDDEKPLC